MSGVNVVLCGADRICADGGLVNGIGTFMIAVTARRLKVPFYVLCETLKFDRQLMSADVDLEEKESTELAPPGTLPDGVTVRNPYFDITPSELITAIITEKGRLKTRRQKLPGRDD